MSSDCFYSTLRDPVLLYVSQKKTKILTRTCLIYAFNIKNPQRVPGVQMATSGIQEISRFHAIVAAKPLHGIGPPVIEPHIPHEPWSVRFHTGKRKRDTPGVVSVANKAVKREHEGNSTREVSTKSSEQLLISF
jgi:hypothetical protein